MSLWMWKGITPLRRPGVWRDGRRCPLAKRKPACEALDNRQLLSTAAPVATEFSMPSAALVTNATTILESLAPKTFAQFQTAMAQAEQDSHVNQADVSALAQDEATVDQDIESASITPYQNGNDLNIVQDWADYALTYGSVGFHVGPKLYPISAVSQRLDRVLANVPAVFHASGPDTSISPIDQLIDQIKVVAKQARLTPAVQSALNRSYNSLNHDLGPDANTMPGPGGTMRDPLIVYYDAQVNDFVKD
jgi:hypothetical protein